MNLEAICGQLVIGGFAGTSLPESYARALRQNRRGGAIFFAKNIGDDPRHIASLAREVHAACPAPLLGIDQEGGRVARLRAPFLAVPPMREVARWGDVSLAERVAHTVGNELAAVGFTIDFAPVLDVNTCAHNPVIGDRAFGGDPAVCARFGAAWVRGLQRAGLLATGKHFPGHGDTSADSHVELPVVEQSRERLEAVELEPFRAGVAAGVGALMTAHVVYPAFDPEQPATLSHAVCTGVRERIGFRGVLISDDLEMQAIAARTPPSDAAVLAIAAGCDAVLLCHSESAQEAAVDAIVRHAEASSAFRARCAEAAARVQAARRRASVRPMSDRAIFERIGGASSRALAGDMEKARVSVR